MNSLVSLLSIVTISAAHVMLMATLFDWKSRINKVVQRHISEERNVGVVVGVIKDGDI